MPDALKKAGRGRPEVDIDLGKLETLAELGCTNKEIAAFFGVTERTIDLRRRKEDFRGAMDKGLANANIKLRRQQLQMALAGDRVMLLWLGKQRLGQQDKVDHSGTINGSSAPTKLHVHFVKSPNESDDESGD